MKFKIGFVLLVLLSQNLLFSQTKEENYKLIDKYDSLAHFHKQVYPDSSAYYTLKMIRLGESYQDIDLLAYSFTFYGALKKNKGEMDSAIYYYEKAIYFQELSDFERGIAGNYNNIATVYRKRGQYLKSIEYYQKAKELFEKLGDELNYNFVLQNIAELYLDLGKNEEAEKEIAKSEKYFSDKDNKIGLGFLYQMKGDISLRQSNYETALSEFNQSLNYFTSIKREIEACRIRLKISILLFDNKQYSSADSLFNITIQQAKNLNLNNELAELYFYKAKFYYIKKEFKKTIDFSIQSLSIIEKTGALNLQYLNYELISKSYSQLGDYKNAYNFQLKYNEIKDSIDNMEIKKSFIELQTQYYVLEKDKEISNFNKIQDSIRIDMLENTVEIEKLRNQSNQQKSRNFYLIIISLIITIVLIIFIKRNRDKKRLNNRLEISLKERELLLKEIHHRVKNNLQIISSLLNLQKNLGNVNNIDELINQTQDRISTMAIIHEKLYQSHNFKDLNAKDYLNNLFSYFSTTYDFNAKKIIIQEDIQSIQLDIDKLIPLGLILNELLTNSIKYAFKNKDGGTISIHITKHEEEIKFIYSDNGVGLPENLDINQSKSLGMKLIQGLTKQLYGKFEIKNNNGFQILIIFKHDNKLNK